MDMMSTMEKVQSQVEPYDSRKRRFRDLFKRKERTSSSSSQDGRKLSGLPRSQPKLERHVSALGVNENAVDSIMGKPKESSFSKDGSARPRPETLLLQRIQTSQRFDPRISPLANSFYEVKPAQPLAADEVLSMFTGAPHFSVGLDENKQHPRVDFPGTDKAVAADYGADERHLGPKWVQEAVQDATQQASTSRGIDVGTIGFKRFLALSRHDGQSHAAMNNSNPDGMDTLARIASLFSDSTPLAADDSADSPKSRDFALFREEEVSAIEYFAQEIGWAPDERVIGHEMGSAVTASLNRLSVIDNGSASPASQWPIATNPRPLSTTSAGFTSSHSRQHSTGTNRPVSGSYFSRTTSGQRPHSTASSISTIPLSSPPLPPSAHEEELRQHRSSTVPQTVTEEQTTISDPTLPGAMAGDQLMADLLRNTNHDTAFVRHNITEGGFSIGARSFWRKDTVVGRVLAGTDGARECLDWISVIKSFRSSGNVSSTSSCRVLPTRFPESAIDGIDLLAKRSAPLHNATTATADDLTVAIDNPPVMGNEVFFESLALVSSEDAGSDSSIGHVLQLTFSSPINTRLGRLHVPLMHDVHFISSYPCHPSAATKNDDVDVEESLARMPSHIGSRLLASARKDSGALVRMRSPVSFEEVQAAERAFNETPAHPLHAAYRYTTIPIATLLSVQPAADAQHARKFSSAYARRSLGEEDGAEEVVILDCRGSEDLEVLARAWCAKVGEHALIGKAGRTCISCCVREARALGLCAVIRV